VRGFACCQPLRGTLWARTVERRGDDLARHRLAALIESQTRGRSNAVGSLLSTGLSVLHSIHRRNVSRSNRTTERINDRLRTLLLALLLTIAAGIAPVVLAETTDFVLIPFAQACGSQSGGC